MADEPPPTAPSGAERTRGSTLSSVPMPATLYVLLVDLAVAATSVAVLFSWHVEARDVGVLALLIVLALGFEEGSVLIGRLQWRLSADLKRDMVSVWAVAAAVALSPASGVVLVVVVSVYVWLRQLRRSGQPLYRMWFTMSSVVIGCLAAGRVASAAVTAWPHLSWGLTATVAVLAAIVVHTSINRALVTLALVGVGVRGRALVGSREDNLTELSTLCLGGLVAVAAIHEPWLCLLVILPMVALQRASVVRELEAAAITDAKTGLLNAVAWEQLAKRELARAQRDQAALAIVIVDIDRFKRVNDRFGHLAGDHVLRAVGRCLTAALREYDGLGRFGGEEFVAVLPEADRHDALVVAERIRARVNQLSVARIIDEVPDFAVDGDEQLSVSVGVCTRSGAGGGPATEVAEMLHAADRALYRAKSNGRNQVQLADGGDDVADRSRV